MFLKPVKPLQLTTPVVTNQLVMANLYRNPGKPMKFILLVVGYNISIRIRIWIAVGVRAHLTIKLVLLILLVTAHN